MLEQNPQGRAERLLARLDALGAALVSSGVSDEAASRVLASASTAVLQALALDELVAAARADREAVPKPLPSAEAAAQAEPEIPLAA